MKVKAVKGFPEKKTYQNTNEWCNSGAYLAKGFNHALEEVGNLEIDLGELICKDRLISKVITRFIQIVESLDCECDSYNGFTCTIHEDKVLAKAIKEQANELVKEGK